MARGWFELSSEGWRRVNQRRPLGTLLIEGLQNALDEQVDRVEVRLDADRLEIEDDGKRGFADPRLVYTLFESDKADAPAQRGHLGRGLKELLSVVQAATVETIGFTIFFDAQGRRVEANGRTRGTRILLARQTGAEELAQARELLRLVIPPPATVVLIDGVAIKAPPLIATLPDCRLQTVVPSAERERLEPRSTVVRLFAAPPARAHLFEMGLPLAPFPTPWHVDVGQRVPRAPASHALEPFSRAELLATLFESLVGGSLFDTELDAGWVEEAIASGRVSDAGLRTFAQRRFPPRSVLATGDDADETARQLGARVLDAAAMSPQVREALRRVLETSRDYGVRQAATSEEVRALKPDEEAVLSFYRHLARQLLDRPITIKLVRRPPNADGFVDDATFDRRRWLLRINLLGHWDLGAPLSATSLGLLLHELAHAETDRHDEAFAAALQRIAGRAAAYLATDGPALCERFGLNGVTLPSAARHLRSGLGAAPAKKP